MSGMSKHLEKITAIASALPIDEEADKRVSEFLAEKTPSQFGQIYNRKQATCLAMKFTGDNTDKVLEFLNEHTEGTWSIEEVNDYYTTIENPLWSKAKFLIKSNWVVIYSESKVQMMSDCNFRRDWE